MSNERRSLPLRRRHYTDLATENSAPLNLSLDDEVQVDRRPWRR